MSWRELFTKPLDNETQTIVPSVVTKLNRFKQYRNRKRWVSNCTTTRFDSLKTKVTLGKPLRHVRQLRREKYWHWILLPRLIEMRNRADNTGIIARSQLEQVQKLFQKTADLCEMLPGDLSQLFHSGLFIDHYNSDSKYPSSHSKTWMNKTL